MTSTSTPTNLPKASRSNLPLADCDCTTDTDPFCRVVVVVSTAAGAAVTLLLLFELVPTVTPSSTCGPRRCRCIFYLFGHGRLPDRAAQDQPWIRVAIAAAMVSLAATVLYLPALVFRPLCGRSRLITGSWMPSHWTVEPLSQRSGHGYAVNDADSRHRFGWQRVNHACGCMNRDCTDLNTHDNSHDRSVQRNMPTPGRLQDW